MKTLILSFALAICGSASTLGLGEQILATPNTQWSFGFNDGSAAGYDDVLGTVTFGPNNLATLDYASNNTPDWDILSLPDSSWIYPGDTESASVVEAGQPYEVGLINATTFQTFETGTQAAWAIEEPIPQIDCGTFPPNPTPTATPEPAPWLLMLFGGALAGLARMATVIWPMLRKDFLEFDAKGVLRK